MFILDNSIGNIMTSMFGARMIAPKWNVSLKPEQGLVQKRNFIQEHLTYGSLLGVPLAGFGIYKLVVGFFSGSEGLKEKIGGGFTLLIGALFAIVGHFNKTNEKEEIDKFIKDFCKTADPTQEKLSDLVLDNSTLGQLYSGIQAIPKGGALLNLFGETNLGKSTLLRVLPEVIGESLKIQLNHDVKVNAIAIDNKFLETKFELFSKSGEEKFKTFIKYYQQLLQEANKGCAQGDVKEIYLLQIEESSHLLNESLKAHLEDFAQYCPGLCIAFTSNETHVREEFNSKRGCFNVPFRAYNPEQKLDIFKLKLRRSLGSNYSDALFERMKSSLSAVISRSNSKYRIDDESASGGSVRDLSGYLYKINPYNIKLIADELGRNLNQYNNGKFNEIAFRGTLAQALKEQMNQHIAQDAKGTTITEAEILDFIQSCFSDS